MNIHHIDKPCDQKMNMFDFLDFCLFAFFGFLPFFAFFGFFLVFNLEKMLNRFRELQQWEQVVANMPQAK